MNTEEGDTAGGSVFASLNIHQLQVTTQQQLEKGSELEYNNAETKMLFVLLSDDRETLSPIKRSL